MFDLSSQHGISVIVSAVRIFYDTNVFSLFTITNIILLRLKNERTAY